MSRNSLVASSTVGGWAADATDLLYRGTKLIACFGDAEGVEPRGEGAVVRFVKVGYAGQYERLSAEVCSGGSCN